MPDYGDDRGFGLDRVNPFEQTAQAGSMPGYRDNRNVAASRAPESLESIGGGTLGAGWGEHPYFGDKRWNPDRNFGIKNIDYTSEQEIPQKNWDNWFGNAVRSTGRGLSNIWDKISQPGYFGGLQAAEINPTKVLESDWAKQQIDWEDLEGGMLSPIGYDKAYQNLKNRGDISSWGDLYKLLQSGGGTGLSGHVLEKGLGDFSSEMGEEGIFPKRSLIPGAQVNPTVESWKGRDYFDVDEGDLEKGRYDELRNAEWLY